MREASNLLDLKMAYHGGLIKTFSGSTVTNKLRKSFIWSKPLIVFLCMTELHF